MITSWYHTNKTCKHEKRLYWYGRQDWRLYTCIRPSFAYLSRGNIPVKWSTCSLHVQGYTETKLYMCRMFVVCFVLFIVWTYYLLFHNRPPYLQIGNGMIWFSTCKVEALPMFLNILYSAFITSPFTCVPMLPHVNMSYIHVPCV